MRGACGSSSESSTKAPKSESDTITPDARTPTSSAFAPRSCASARSDTTIFVPSTLVILTSMVFPTWPSSAATAASLPVWRAFFSSFSAAGTAGGGTKSSSSSSKDARGAVTVLGAVTRVLFTFRVRLEAICDKGRNARNRPLNTRRMSPPRFATSTRPFTGSPFSSARISAFFASAFLESSAFLPLPSFVAVAAEASPASPEPFSARARTPRPRDAETARRAIGVLGAPDETRAGARWDARAAVETAAHCARVDAMVST
jgi:hypothetical protein